MSKHDEVMASVIGKAMLREDLRKRILADPEGALVSYGLPGVWAARCCRVLP